MTRTGRGEDVPGKTRAAFALIAVALLAVLAVNSATTPSKPTTGASPARPAVGETAVIATGATPSTPSAVVPRFSSTLEWPLAYFHASSVWTHTEGRNVKVAVVDTGVDAGQSDLAGAVLPPVDLSPGPPGDESPRSHGTAVAGLIAGRGSPADPKRVAGLAPQALLIDVRIAPRVADVSAAAIASGITAAVKAGAQVINVSLGVPKDDSQLDQAVALAGEHDCLVVADAGAGRALQYPAALPEVLAVGAIGQNLKPITSLAKYRQATVYAPGQNLYSTAETGRTGGGHDGYIAGLSGSDYATAYVSGAAALALSRAPWLHADGTQKLLTQAISPNAVGSGPGILDPLAALQELPPSGPVTPRTSAGHSLNPTPLGSVAAAPGFLRSAEIALAVVLVILFVAYAIIWLIKSGGGPGTPRGRRRGHIPSSLDVHF